MWHIIIRNRWKRTREKTEKNHWLDNRNTVCAPADDAHRRQFLGSDDFVPTEMVYRLHAAKAGKKGLWVAEGAAHAQAYAVHREEYVRRLRQFLSD